MLKTVRMVLDTNVVISSCLGGEDSPNKEILQLWSNGKIKLLFSRDVLYEYIKKLSYKNVSVQFIKDLVKDLKFYGEFVEIEYFHLRFYPKDQDDIAFVLCAENGKANYLISYDEHLLSLNGLHSFEICRPLDFLFEFRGVVKK